MGNGDEKLMENEKHEGGSSTVSAVVADFRLLLGQFREFAVVARWKPIAAVALLFVEIALILFFVFSFARLADLAAATGGGGAMVWAVERGAGEMTVFLSLAAVLFVTCRYFERLWMMTVGEYATAGLSKKVFAQVVSQPMTFPAGHQAASIDAKVVDDISRVRRAWNRDLLVALRSGVSVLVAAILIFNVAPTFARPAIGIALALGAVSIFSIWRFSRKDTSECRAGEMSGLGAAISEVIGGLAMVKAFGNENHERTRFRHRVENLLGTKLRSAGRRLAVQTVGSLALLGLPIYLWWLGAAAASDGSFEAGEFMLFVLLLIVVGAAMRQLGRSTCRLMAASRAARRLDELLAGPTERLDAGKFMPGSRERLEGRLNISKASFACPGAPEYPVIDSLSLAISPGGKIAVVGPPGSGKTALAHLILGYFPLQSGTVEIDDRPLDDYPLSWLRSQIGWVPTETYLFSGTVAENIGYGKAGASATDIREAAEKAGALPFIESLPDGFDTGLASDIGGADVTGLPDGGLRLSAVQKRRIGLARVFLEDPPMVFIDAPATRIVAQATTDRDDVQSAGDSSDRSLSSVEEALIEGRTAIVVATRMTTTRTMDKILVLRDGKVAERGSHKELYEGRGFYRLLCEGQFGKD